MPALHEFWDPNEWELHAYGLLRDRHGALNVHKVPARHKGDLGVDYYCLTDVVAYQCFAVQEPCSVRTRAEKQKAKITTDLKKFRTKKAELSRIFRNTPIRRWVLLVPLHDSAEVNSHCAKKTSEVKKCGLPYVSMDFEVLIQDLDSFDAKSRELRARQRQELTLPSVPPSSEQLSDWSAASNSLIDTLVKKLRKRVGTTNQRDLDDLTNKTIGWFLERENQFEALRNDAPDLYESLVAVIARRFERLLLLGNNPAAHANQILRDELDGLVSALRTEIPNFSEASAHQVAMGTIADWMLRCPLDFPPYDNVQ